MALRYIIGIVLATCIWIGVIHFTHLPADIFAPPSASISNVKSKATGYFLTVQESRYTEHWWEGSLDTEYYMHYKFQPKQIFVQSDGTEKAVQSTDWQEGVVQVHSGEYDKYKTGDPLAISYDPYNPLINGLTGTQKFNIKASFFSGWLYYLLGYIATVILFERLASLRYKSETD
jgi:hypothetical protein